MSPTIISLLTLILLLPTLFVGQIVPLFNLHLANSTDALLRAKLTEQLSRSLRTAKPEALVISDLLGIIIPGVQTKTARLSEDGEYIIAELEYQHNALIVSQYFDQSRLKTIKVVTVKVE